MARSYVLARGPRVCLRLARPRDLDGMSELCCRQGLEPGELELARLVRCDPRRRIVLCATALIGSAETVLGIGAIDLDANGMPAFVIVDDACTDGLGELLTDALIGRAGALTRSRAA